MGKVKSPFDDTWDSNGRRKASITVAPTYRTRFIKQSELGELANLYHLAKVPLSDGSKYDRMQWATREFHKLHPTYSQGAIYKDLSSQLEGY
jgi:hypothetical protein